MLHNRCILGLIEKKETSKRRPKSKPNLSKNASYFLLNQATCLRSLFETLMAAIEEDEVSVILEEQREEIMAAKTLAQDHDLAFNLQMQEALAVSKAAHTSSVPNSPTGDAGIVDFTGEEEEFDFTSLIL